MDMNNSVGIDCGVGGRLGGGGQRGRNWITITKNDLKIKIKNYGTLMPKVLSVST